MEDTRREIHKIGHRRFVGGDGDFWDAIGELQFRFMLDRGLSPADVFVDVGCGSLRGGAKFIRYLEPQHYLGIDKHIDLIIYGAMNELGAAVYEYKEPQFVVSDAFEFDRFDAKPAFGLAQSLFTHLTAADIQRCLSNLARAGQAQCRLFATFFEAQEATENPTTSHSHGYFAYTRLQMEEFGTAAGWSATYIGDWGHPRDQKMMEFVLGERCNASTP
jgi:hypothetical protein